MFPFAFYNPVIPSVLTTEFCNEEMPFLFATIPLSRVVIILAEKVTSLRVSFWEAHCLEVQLTFLRQR